MNLKTTYILFGVLLVALLLLGLTQFMGWQKAGVDSNWVLADLHDKSQGIKDDELRTISSVEVQRTLPGSQPEKIVFTHGPKGWEIEQPAKLRADNSKVENLIRDIYNARREKSEMLSGLKEYGLDDPEIVVTLRKDDREWKLNVGKGSGGKGEGSVLYVTDASRPKVPMAVQRSSLDALFKSINDFRSTELVSASSWNTSQIQLQDPKNNTIALEKTEDSRWRYQKPAYGEADFEGESSSPSSAPKRITGVRELIDAVGGLRVESDKDFVASNVSDKDLAEKYGLAAQQPERLRIEVKHTQSGLSSDQSNEAVTDVLLIGKKVEAAKDSIKKDAKKDKEPETKPEEYYYARLENETAVVRLPANKVEPILGVLIAPDALRSRELITKDSTASNKIDAINIEGPTSGLLQLRKAEPLGKWQLFRDKSTTGQVTDEATVQELLQALTAKQLVKTFPEKADGLELDRPVAVVSVWLEGINRDTDSDKNKDKKDEDKDKDQDKKKDDKKEDKKDNKKKDSGLPKLKSDKPTVKLSFGRRDKDKGLVYVRREVGDEKTLVAVPDSLLDRVAVGPLAFLNRELPTFTTEFDPEKSDVSKVVWSRDGQTYEITKEMKGDAVTWKFQQPKKLVGRTAYSLPVRNLLDDLRRLRALKLVSEKPAPKELEQLYGLKPPAYQITLTLAKKDKPEEWTYQFGKQTDDKTGVYAKQSQRDMVFTVSKSILAVLQSDLRDPAVFDFAPSKVKSVKLTGWQNVVGSPFTLDLEHKDGKTWTVKAPAGFQLNPSRVDDLLNLLSHLQADKFVTLPAKKQPDFNVKKGALKIEIALEGVKEPLWLLVGEIDPDHKDSYLASSSTLPGDLFRLPKTFFEKIREKTAYFAKP